MASEDVTMRGVNPVLMLSSMAQTDWDPKWKSQQVIAVNFSISDFTPDPVLWADLKSEALLSILRALSRICDSPQKSGPRSGGGAGAGGGAAATAAAVASHSSQFHNKETPNHVVYAEELVSDDADGNPSDNVVGFRILVAFLNPDAETHIFHGFSRLMALNNAFLASASELPTDGPGAASQSTDGDDDDAGGAGKRRGKAGRPPGSAHSETHNFVGRFPDGVRISRLHVLFFRPEHMLWMPLPNRMRVATEKDLASYNAMQVEYRQKYRMYRAQRMNGSFTKASDRRLNDEINWFRQTMAHEARIIHDRIESMIESSQSQSVRATLERHLGGGYIEKMLRARNHLYALKPTHEKLMKDVIDQYGRRHGRRDQLPAHAHHRPLDAVRLPVFVGPPPQPPRVRRRRGGQVVHLHQDRRVLVPGLFPARNPHHEAGLPDGQGHVRHDYGHGRDARRAPRH